MKQFMIGELAADPPLPRSGRVVLPDGTIFSPLAFAEWAEGNSGTWSRKGVDKLVHRYQKEVDTLQAEIRLQFPGMAVGPVWETDKETGARVALNLPARRELGSKYHNCLGTVVGSGSSEEYLAFDLDNHCWGYGPGSGWEVKGDNNSPPTTKIKPTVSEGILARWADKVQPYAPSPEQEEAEGELAKARWCLGYARTAQRAVTAMKRCRAVVVTLQGEYYRPERPGTLEIEESLLEEYEEFVRVIKITRRGIRAFSLGWARCYRPIYTVEPRCEDTWEELCRRVGDGW